MKAILLAAGKGTRISRMIEDVPKSTLPVNGTPLIRITVQMLLAFDIEPVVCIGYKADKIVEALKGLAVKYYVNPFYDITNSIASLWFARQEMEGDILILNADVYFSVEILKNVLNSRPGTGTVMAIDKTRKDVGDYFFATSDSGSIIRYGKDLPLSVRTCEYVGIAKISNHFVSAFVQRMESLISSQQHHLWWENVLYSFTDNQEMEINTVDVNGQFWSEIDYFDDYERILTYIEEAQGE